MNSYGSDELNIHITNAEYERKTNKLKVSLILENTLEEKMTILTSGKEPNFNLKIFSTMGINLNKDSFKGRRKDNSNRELVLKFKRKEKKKFSIVFSDNKKLIEPNETYKVQAIFPILKKNEGKYIVTLLQSKYKKISYPK